ncbi:MAG: hypothetical protein ACK4ND_01450 [Cytophagaceae bacterium]
MKLIFSLFVPVIFLASCNVKSKENNNESVAANNNSWLRGSTEEKFKKVENHLRGFDIAMAEVGYRYTELYWAGCDSNWDYAEYQAVKIRRVIELAKERRPNRANSAIGFLDVGLKEMDNVIKNKDTVNF